MFFKFSISLSHSVHSLLWRRRRIAWCWRRMCFNFYSFFRNEFWFDENQTARWRNGICFYFRRLRVHKGISQLIRMRESGLVSFLQAYTVTVAIAAMSVKMLLPENETIWFKWTEWLADNVPIIVAFRLNIITTEQKQYPCEVEGVGG